MSAFVGLDLAKNLGYLTVPVVFLTSCFLPHAYAVMASGKVYDNANPRGWKDAMAKADMDKPRQQRLLRAQNASENGFESIGIYAAGVIAANQAGLSASTVNALTLGYLASRLAYVFSYVELGANRRLSGVRSGFWVLSMGLCFTLWVKAGLKAVE
ncbi:hypothetical protein EsDP_00000132 [Epichloe bromicola]|uniref:Uncharacterized protein n=1 Tax=Epichloe bromicola TaxID=79588 RepID=A0ABQ0CE00_9HYPO